MSPYKAQFTLIVAFIINFPDILLATNYRSCEQQSECANKAVTCPSQGDCNIICGPHGCENAHIQCPMEGNCTIICQDEFSCSDATINATKSNGNFDLICSSKQSDDECRGIKVYGSTLSQSQNTGDHFNVKCGFGLRSCRESTIYCPSAIDCNIECNGTHSACRYSTIYGPINKALTVECLSKWSCDDIFIDATESSSLSITGCTESEACYDMTAYCPPNILGNKQCYIEGSNALAMDTNGLQLYAINGWDDIEINYSGDYSQPSGGTMHCGHDYSVSCNILNDGWSCANQSCGELTLSPSTSFTSALPTMYPTYAPTIYPTSTPSTNPSPAPAESPIAPKPTSDDVTTSSLPPTFQGDQQVNEARTTQSGFTKSNGNPTNQTKQNTTMIIIIVCSAFTFFIVAMSIFFYLRYSKRKQPTDERVPKSESLKSRVNTMSSSKHIYQMGMAHHALASSEVVSDFQNGLAADGDNSKFSSRAYSEDITLDGSLMVTVQQALANQDPLHRASEVSQPQQQASRHKASFAPSHLSYASEAMMVQSVHNDEEVIGTDEEDVNYYKFKTPSGDTEKEQEYEDRLGQLDVYEDEDEVEEKEKEFHIKVNNENLIQKPKMAPMQSEGGEQYHKLPDWKDRPSNMPDTDIKGGKKNKSNLRLEIPVVNEDQEDDDENDNNHHRLIEEDMITPIDITPNGDDAGDDQQEQLQNDNNDDDDEEILKEIGDITQDDDNDEFIHADQDTLEQSKDDDDEENEPVLSEDEEEMITIGDIDDIQ